METRASDYAFYCSDALDRYHHHGSIYRTTMLKSMRSGYYLAKTDTLHGDFRLCKDLRQMFLALGYPDEKDGKGGAQHFDGISRWITADGAMITRLILRDFFNSKPQTFFIRDL
jgi:hypothetical protein